MRACGKLFVIIALGVAALGIAEGQPPIQIQPGLLGGKKGGDYFSLLQLAQIKSELKVTEQQMEKLPVAALKALAEVLDDGQVKRLRQIYLQQRGNPVYLEADVRKELKITDEQAKKIQAAMDTAAKAQQELIQGGFDLQNFQELMTKTQELQKTATDAVMGTLTAEQKATWTKMIGEPFQFKGGKKGPE